MQTEILRLVQTYTYDETYLQIYTKTIFIYKKREQNLVEYITKLVSLLKIMTSPYLMSLIIMMISKHSPCLASFDSRKCITNAMQYFSEFIYFLVIQNLVA